MRVISSLLFITVCAIGAEAADLPIPGPALVIGVPNPGRAAERFASSFVGKAWFAPDNAPLRDLVATTLHLPAGATAAQLARIDAAGGPGGFTITVVSPTLAQQLAGLAGPASEWTSEVVDGVLHMHYGEHPPTAPVASGAADLSVAWNIAPLVAEAKGDDRRLTELMAKALPPGSAEWTWIPEGLATRLRLAAASAILIPLDRAALAPVPADALAVQAIGLDGDAWWTANQQWCAELLTALKVERPLSEVFAGVGLPADPREVFAALKGTAVMVIRDGATMPPVTLLLPRNPQLDRVIEAGMRALGCPLPEVGSSTPLLPDPPDMEPRERQQLAMITGMFGASLGRTATTWILSTDAFLSGDLLAGTSGGWSEGAIGKLALSKVDAQTCSLMATDGQRAFRSMAQYASMFASQLPDRKQSAALVKLGVALARSAGPGYTVGRRDGAGFMIEGRGPGLDLLFPGGNPGSAGIIAAIAIPNLLESRVTANEAAAAATLKSGIFPAQVQFQAGAYVDEDSDGRGEYGFLTEFSGGPVPGFNKTLQLLAPGDWSGVRNGYHYVVYLPDGAGGGGDSRSALGQNGIGDREAYWVAYAWPEKDQGRKVFAICHTGMIYQQPMAKGPATATKPAWNDLFGGGDKSWADQPTWLPYHR